MSMYTDVDISFTTRLDWISKDNILMSDDIRGRLHPLGRIIVIPKAFSGDEIFSWVRGAFEIRSLES